MQASDYAAQIGTGRDLPKQGHPATDDEMRKRITSIAMAGLGQLLFDNVDQLGGPSLEAALTAATWQDRQLGGNQMTPELPLRVTWFATGNNVILKGDMPRRVLHIRLESMEESPEERTGFRHPDLLGWVRENRGRLVVAALSVLRGYVAAGRPDMKLRPWGSYEGWSALVRSATTHRSIGDEAQNPAAQIQRARNQRNPAEICPENPAICDWRPKIPSTAPKTSKFRQIEKIQKSSRRGVAAEDNCIYKYMCEGD